MTQKKFSHLSLNDFRHWLLSDSIVAWLLDLTSPKNHSRSIDALILLVEQLGDPTYSTVEISKNLSLHLDRGKWRILLVCNGARSECPHSFQNYLRGDSGFPESLAASLPGLLYRSKLRHPRLIWQERGHSEHRMLSHV